MKILLVEDDKLSRNSIKNFLVDYLNFDVIAVENCEKGLKIYKTDFFPIVISDINMPGMNGIDLLRAIKKLDQEKRTEVIMITGFGDLGTAVEALRAGAADYFLKPIQLEELTIRIERLQYKKKIEAENKDLTKNFSTKLNESTNKLQKKIKQYQSIFSGISGFDTVGVFSEAFRKNIILAEKLHHDRSIPVLVQGETGTGKEIISNMIHNFTGNTGRPMIKINCSAISSNLFESELFGYAKGAFTGGKSEGSMGKLELAQGGTILLDEIGEMPLDLQPKLLRVLEEKCLYPIGGNKKVDLDLRFIFSTNRNLEGMVKNGSFRADLYYRINTATIMIPPLRERKEEIGPLAQMFLLQESKLKKRSFLGFTTEAIKILGNYNWPGNVRELKNMVERIVLLYDEQQVRPDHLNFLETEIPKELTDDPNLLKIRLPQDGLDFIEIEYIIINKVLEICNNNKTKAAQYLNIARNTLLRKLNK